MLMHIKVIKNQLGNVFCRKIWGTSPQNQISTANLATFPLRSVHRGNSNSWKIGQWKWWYKSISHVEFIYGSSSMSNWSHLSALFSRFLTGENISFAALFFCLFAHVISAKKLLDFYRWLGACHDLIWWPFVCLLSFVNWCDHGKME